MKGVVPLLDILLQCCENRNLTSSKFLGPMCVLRNGSMPPGALVDSEGGV